jgi:hypothetical protein
MKFSSLTFLQHLHDESRSNLTDLLVILGRQIQDAGKCLPSFRAKGNVSKIGQNLHSINFNITRPHRNFNTDLRDLW